MKIGLSVCQSEWKDEEMIYNNTITQIQMLQVGLKYFSMTFFDGSVRQS